ncbi:MAG TPA: thioesterase family protein [Burkholderiaceae bacterium]|nr:thioesterase family protein [Burkholderiaceae bacterium]
MYADFRHRIPLRVRWAEVDKQGVVFNAHYLLYCDVCITEYWRAVGVHYPDDFVSRGSDLFVRKSTVEYFSAAYYDDELEVCGRIALLGNSSLRFVVEIYRRRQYEAVLIVAELIYVYTELASRTAHPIPDEMRAQIRTFETTVPEERTDANRPG